MDLAECHEVHGGVIHLSLPWFFQGFRRHSPQSAWALPRASCLGRLVQNGDGIAVAHVVLLVEPLHTLHLEVFHLDLH